MRRGAWGDGSPQNCMVLPQGAFRWISSLTRDISTIHTHILEELDAFCLLLDETDFRVCARCSSLDEGLREAKQTTWECRLSLARPQVRETAREAPVLTI